MSVSLLETGRSPWPKRGPAQKEIISQTDNYLVFVILSSKTYVFEDKLTKF